MNYELWQKIQDFQFGDIDEDYSFSLRLANENFWSHNFAEKALLEYKKFMYLAAVSVEMVSPSPIVDEVWHLHIIYTKSYSDFCKILGKNIQHVPSTNNRSEMPKFLRAKEYTARLYGENFGAAPRELWRIPDMYASLNLEKSEQKLRSKVIYGIFIGIFLLIPLFVLLKPLYIHIDNPEFLIYYFLIFIGLLVVLYSYDYFKFNKVFSRFDSISFIFDLDVSEILFLKKESILPVVISFTNKLIVEKKIALDVNNDLVSVFGAKSQNEYEEQILDELRVNHQTSFKSLYFAVRQKPRFANISNFNFALSKYFRKSKYFNQIYLLNFGILGFYILLGISRILIGVSRGKSVMFITFLVLCSIIIATIFLQYLNKLFTSKIMVNYYLDEFFLK